MIPELWDAETGLIQRKVAYTKLENGISINLVLGPLSSRFVVFKEQSTGENDAGLATDLQFGLPKEDQLSIIDLTRDWQVSFDTAMGGPNTYSMKTLTSWPDIDLAGIKYYSGTAAYTKAFTVGEGLSKQTDAYIAFEDIQETARLFVNDNDCGILWAPPYRANITRYLKTGTNKIRIEVTNTWNNRIVGDLRNPDRRAYTRTNAASKFGENSSLLKSGLIGKAAILFSNSELK